MTFGSSMQRFDVSTTTLTVPPHCSQTEMSMLKTRFNRWAHVMAARYSAGVISASSGADVRGRRPLPAGVTPDRQALFGGWPPRAKPP